MKLVAYLGLWFFVACVSAVDTYFNIRFPVTETTELNPFAASILHASHGDVALLVALKFLGTAIALSFLLIVYFYNKRIAYPVMFVLALLQLGLLFVLFG